VGQYSQASVAVSPQTPNSPVSIAFALKLNDPLNVGDSILLNLRDFSIPSGTIILPNELSNSYFAVSGDSARAIQQTNKDGSLASILHPASVILSVVANISENTLIQVSIPLSSGIVSSVNGLGVGNMPTMAILSRSSPMSTANIVDYTPIGSVDSSKLLVMHGNASSSSSSAMTTMKNTTFIFSFKLNCALENGSAFNISLPSFQGNDEVLSFSIGRNSRWTKVFGRWEAMASQFYLRLPFRVGVGLLNIVVSSLSLTESTQLIYDNDPNYRFTLSSAICPIDSMAFSQSIGNVFSSFSVSFLNPLVSAVTGIQLNFKVGGKPLHSGDVLQLTLPGLSSSLLSYGKQEITLDTLQGQSSTLFNDTFSLWRQYGSLSPSLSLSLNLTVTSPIAAGAVLSVVIPNTALISLSSNGTNLNDKNFKLSAVLTNNSTSKSRYLGSVQSVQAVKYFLKKSVVLSSNRPSALTDLTCSFQLPERLARGDTVQIEMPGFTISTAFNSNVPGLLSLTIFGSAALYFTAKWDAPSARLIFYAERMVPAYELISGYIPLQPNAFTTPAAGVPYPSPLYRISCLSGTAPVSSVPLDSITTVPALYEAKLVFIGAMSDESVELAGDTKKMQLFPGHRFTSKDIGMQIMVKGEYYTISDVDGDMISIEEPYLGEDIILGLPYSPLYSPHVRPALYVNGSGTNILLFRYLVRRGDNMIGINRAAVTSFNHLSEPLDPNGGALLRYSTKPLLQGSH
jgi:hypothetical protein